MKRKKNIRKFAIGTMDIDLAILKSSTHGQLLITLQISAFLEHFGSLQAATRLSEKSFRQLHRKPQKTFISYSAVRKLQLLLIPV